MSTIGSYINTPWMGTLLGVIGVLLAILFYLRGRVIRRLAYQGSTSSVIGGGRAELPPEVAVSYNGVPVPRVTKATVIIWNAGNTTVHGRDLVASDPLRITLPEGCGILDTRIVKCSRDVTGIHVAASGPAKNSVLVTFDFLDALDGARIDILHVGDPVPAEIVGTIKGLRNGCMSYGAIPPSDRSPNPFMARNPLTRLIGRTPQAFFTIIFIVGLAAALIGLFPDPILSLLPGLGKPDPTPLLVAGRINWIPIIVGLLYVAPAGLLLWQFRRRYPRELAESAIRDSDFSAYFLAFARIAQWLR